MQPDDCSFTRLLDVRKATAAPFVQEEADSSPRHDDHRHGQQGGHIAARTLLHFSDAVGREGCDWNEE